MDIKKLNPIIYDKINVINQLCIIYKIETLYIFGSATNNKFSNKSDLDFLVTFGDVPIIDYADYFFDFMHELETLFNRKIDLITEQSLTNPYLIKSINNNKQLIYDRRNKEVFV